MGLSAGPNKKMSLPENLTKLHALFRKGYRHPAMSMADTAMQMKRSPNRAFILVVGLSGAGKSSTVNYLFQTNVAAISDTQSKTMSTTEYTVELESPEWRIPDLPLSIIDTPGFCSTHGIMQDARNVISIKHFLKSHPDMKNNSYPNLVMIVQNIMDVRVEGESSNFVKMLKGISCINAIDQENPNVVVVLTHAASIGTDSDLWEKEVAAKKLQIGELITIYLGVTPEIAVQENKPINFKLDLDGDWHRLPNGDQQPKILYEACERILNCSKDEIGHEAVAIFFRPGGDKNVRTGKTTSSLDVSKTDTETMHNIFLESILNPSKSEVYTMLEDYKRRANMTTLSQPIFILQLKFRNHGLTKASDLQNMSLNKVMAMMYPTSITKEMQKVLTDVFGLSYEQSAGVDFYVGKGYNIFKDSATQFSPLVMTEDDKNQHGLPANVDLRECASLEIKCEIVKDNADYIHQRLRELQIDTNGDINFEGFKLQLRSGYNKQESDSFLKTQTSNRLSFSVEHRIQKIQVRHSYKVTKEFTTDVKNLPSNYDLKDKRNLMIWKAFFDKWGMFVVTGAYIGGSLTGYVTLSDDQSFDSSSRDAQTALRTKIGFLQQDATIDFSKEDDRSTNLSLESSIRSTSLTWNGGNRETYKSSLESIEPNDWEAWVDSLKYSPAPLWSSLDLLPLYQLVYTTNQEKAIQMQMATELVLKGQFTYAAPKEDNRENTGTSNKSKQCFHESSCVMLHNEEVRRMKDLSVGDKILITGSNGTLAEDEVIAWLHQTRDGEYTFLLIHHDQGKITLSPEHIIFVGKGRNPQHASTIRPGDEICFFKNDDGRQLVIMAIVLSIHKVERKGLYAPLTFSGRLIVDNVDVSCYCILNPLKIFGQEILSSHSLAHSGFLPLRMAFKFGFNINNSQLTDDTGVHGYARWLMHLLLPK